MSQVSDHQTILLKADFASKGIANSRCKENYIVEKVVSGLYIYRRPQC